MATDQGCGNRQYSKGTTFWIRKIVTAPCVWGAAFKLAGVKSISAPSMKRSGDVDATELAPAPLTLDNQPVGIIPQDTIEENYYFTGQCPGTKKIDPIKLELNLSWANFISLMGSYATDELFSAFIQFRNGNRFYFDPSCYVSSMDLDIQENTFVTVALEIQTTYRVMLIPTGFVLPANCTANVPTT